MEGAKTSQKVRDKDEQKYAGIRFILNTTDVDAVVQAFYMLRSFKNMIFGLDLSNEYENLSGGVPSLPLAIQKTFAWLKETNYSDIDIIPLFESIIKMMHDNGSPEEPGNYLPALANDELSMFFDSFADLISQSLDDSHKEQFNKMISINVESRFNFIESGIIQKSTTSKEIQLSLTTSKQFIFKSNF